MNLISRFSNAVWGDHNQTKDIFLFTQLRRRKKENIELPRQKKSYTKSQFVGLILGPLAFLLVMFVLPLEGLSSPGRAVLAFAAWLAIWWILEAMPLGITSLLPLALMPVLTPVDSGTVASAYGDPLIFLFLGGFTIALAMEKWNLHERIALTIISMVGASLSGLILGFALATGFLSMWVSNMATIMLMIPIGTAIIAKVAELMKQDGVHTEDEENKFTKSIIFAIGFGGTIGGSATLIGTPTNLILASMTGELLGYEIPFGTFLLFAFPLTAILMVVFIMYLTKVAYPMKVKTISKGKEFVLERKAELGKASFEEKVVLAIFIFTAFMWLTRTFIWTDIIPGINDTMIAMISAMLLFLIPSKNKKGTRILESDTLAKMPWGVLLLVGGGLALATGFTGTDLADWMGGQLMNLESAPLIIIIAVSALLSILMTQMAPNTATVTILLPITAALATAINVHPLPIMAATALGAGFAFMLPIGTPSNALIYATGKITIVDMLRKGTWLTMAAVVLIVIFVYYIMPFMFGIDKFSA
ncbi:DASS family sodium-coupled anion symporter [Salinicoccus sp. RF5]|uniref:SLC13 family permease n=1 Tax=Salinicoccus sp. RF5 TaxID=2748874 RepID=UPI001E3DCC31|nr:SLC13 family permease [Salinicoccus sp. RF5]MCC4722878.1 SLC13 family permease [Salinicoccus sp. RF5]